MSSFFVSRFLRNATNSRRLNQSNMTPLIIPKASVSKMIRYHGETDEQFDDRMECYFSRPELDGWDLRQGLTDLAGVDAVPEPRVLIAALCACRRVNDYALATRLLEMVHFKCGPKPGKRFAYILQEVGPVLQELGVDTLEKLGYHQPELASKDVYDM